MTDIMFQNTKIKKYDMKNICKMMVCLLISTTFLAGCDDLLGVDSKRLATDEEFGQSPNDTLYSTFGIMSQLQKLADSYVLLGELRGDLMTITDKSDLSLLEINNFNISRENPYVNINNYYAVINNCNYILQNLDSARIDKGQKLMLGHYAAIKSIRAWTYMQIVLNFKTAKYYENAILTVEDSKRTYPEYDINELARVLIADLTPLKDVPFPNMGYIGSYNTTFSYFPIRFLLGDLYLWTGDYQNAATEYFNLMYKNRLSVNRGFTSSWQTVNNTIGTTANINWIGSLIPGSGEVISAITCPTQYGQRYDLDSLNMQRKIIPSDIAIKNWDEQTYFLNESSNSEGDLRKYGSVWWKDIVNVNTTKTTVFNSKEESTNLYIIFKYLLTNQSVVVYRSSLLYLRYAEAVNRLNKPNLAFAVLKYGLNSTNMYNAKIVPSAEKDSASASYMNFTDTRFVNNVGLRMRGVGNSDKDTTFYTFRTQDTMRDSVLFVEDLIRQELALETAFDGNRFHDLMRISMRRISNGEGDASYLANLVSAKHGANQAAIRNKLMDINNWYLKK